MNPRIDPLAVHQLIGRAVYFHTLFIEPHMPAPLNVPGPRCCNHTPRNPQPTCAQALTDAWNALPVTAGADPAARCPRHSPDCCASCRIHQAAKSIATTWALTEHVAHHQAPAPTPVLAAFRTAAAAHITTALNLHLSVPRCPAARRTAPPTPADGRLPLTEELVALWAAATSSGTPIVSVLNHCTTLADITQLATRTETRQ
ncbi:hypothetical protein [Streptomyces sp. CS014]|uniref:hypothetical protein n=1 Tax=Streptomyces sp. CS014 TaxID=2162707 RepID=UPI000D515D4A|nr:hypothetical protein [Streptomyces sp. CS014]PVD04480.1 hypothetical protein DBP12_03380 [Streptomyces sp. CS014]